MEGSTGKTLTGRVVNTHHSRPPVFTFWNGAPVARVLGRSESSRRRSARSTPRPATRTAPSASRTCRTAPTSWSIWDEPLDMIIGTTTFAVGGSQPHESGRSSSVRAGSVATRVACSRTLTAPACRTSPRTSIARSSMSTRSRASKAESNQTFKAGDLKPPFGEGVANNIRFRDGSIYQSIDDQEGRHLRLHRGVPVLQLHGRRDRLRPLQGDVGATVVVDDGGQDATPALNGGHEFVERRAGPVRQQRPGAFIRPVDPAQPAAAGRQ